ncbi:unnamed protein product [Macrosiphum euphorbiae]|uniref:Uncharacterized protein n=1 Tax=Macrosiphum euphorbiae TaxID=13131 RepID=A0AAV0WE77_9HEMI|nr:unnamed protein product [Macrosiphum euphorbiae]
MLKWLINDTEVVKKALHHSFLINESEILELDRIQTSILEEDSTITFNSTIFFKQRMEVFGKSCQNEEKRGNMDMSQVQPRHWFQKLHFM